MSDIEGLYRRLDKRSYLRDRFEHADNRDLDAILEIRRQSIAGISRCRAATGQRIKDVFTITADRYVLVGRRDRVVLYIDGRATAPCTWERAEQMINDDWWERRRAVKETT
jgi:hypothetical protein